ncbi:MAG: hypothetical protein NVSMB46_09510 [Candidatus Saccharimonadales bacterium]
MNIVYFSQTNPDTTSLPHLNVLNDGSLVKVAIQLVLAILGGIALVVITLAGLKYIISRGDPQAVAKAKNTILYAVIGLVIAMMAEVIVSFGISKILQ